MHIFLQIELGGEENKFKIFRFASEAFSGSSNKLKTERYCQPNTVTSVVVVFCLLHEIWALENDVFHVVEVVHLRGGGRDHDLVGVRAGGHQAE